jgi:hypothetical protein
MNLREKIRNIAVKIAAETIDLTEGIDLITDIKITEHINNDNLYDFMQRYAIWIEEKELNFCADSFDDYLKTFNININNI